MPPPTNDSSEKVTPKIEPRDSPLPALYSSSPTNALPDSAWEESFNDNAEEVSAGNVRHKVRGSQFTIEHARQEVLRRLALSQGTRLDSNASSSALGSMPPSAGAREAHGSTPEPATPSSETQNLDAKPFDPFVDMPAPAHRKRAWDESNDNNTEDASAGGVGRNIRRSMISRNSAMQEASSGFLTAFNARSGNNTLDSALDSSPPPTGARDAHGSAPDSDFTSPTTGLKDSQSSTPIPESVQNEYARLPNPWIANPNHGGHGPRLRHEALDDDQRRVIHMAVDEVRNICIVGGAGTGKSVICEILLDQLRDQDKNVSIVTPSGTSAVNVHAQTLHSFFGLGGESNKGIDEYKENMGVCLVEKLKKLHTLVIDESSMVSYEMFDRMDQMLRAARDNDQPFGGIQLIVFGDFCQLPPVKPHQHCYKCGREREGIILRGRGRGRKGEKVWVCSKHGEIKDSNKMWVFESKTWELMEFAYLPLSKGHRQADQRFLAVLDRLRHGKPFRSSDITLLLEHPSDATNAVQLVSQRVQAQSINNNRFNSHELRDAQSLRYECRDDFKWQTAAHPELADINQNIEAALNQHPYEQFVRLKVGQPVILQKNLDVEKGLVNGSQGIIINFVPYDQAEQSRDLTTDGGEIAQLRRNNVLDFILGQGYPSIPVVKFNDVDEPATVYPDCSISERGFKKPHSLLMRTQIPLLSGWAMTIHKAQGMTLDRAIVHLDHCWQSGMAYVALSRVKNLVGLKVLRLKADHLNHAMDEQVKIFLHDKFGENFN
jgi:ATP-dependent DNA helicase PIF1